MASRQSWAAVATAVIFVGVTRRLAPLGLPVFAKKYGGSILWGAMVYALVRTVSPRGSMIGALSTSVAIAVAVETFRLVHTPWLDAFRLTLAGQLLLGRIFSFWNILAYATGIAVAAGIHFVHARQRAALDA